MKVYLLNRPKKAGIVINKQLIMNKIFFRVGKLHTNQIEEVEYKSLIIELFREYCDVNLDPEAISLVVNREYGGYKTFSFVVLPDGVNAQSVIEAIDQQVTPEGYQLGASIAQDKPRDNDGYRNNRGGSRDNNRRRY